MRRRQRRNDYRFTSLLARWPGYQPPKQSWQDQPIISMLQGGLALIVVRAETCCWSETSPPVRLILQRTVGPRPAQGHWTLTAEQYVAAVRRHTEESGPPRLGSPTGL